MFVFARTWTRDRPRPVAASTTRPRTTAVPVVAPAVGVSLAG